MHRSAYQRGQGVTMTGGARGLRLWRGRVPSRVTPLLWGPKVLGAGWEFPILEIILFC